MAKNTTTKAKAPGKTEAEAPTRFQLVWDDDTARKAKDLAKIEVRSFNNLMAWLVNKEWERHQKKTI